MSSVQLYVYDLSQGMARVLSMGMVGKQIDAIWHTSVVVHGREFFFGQGVMDSVPGQTHHGRPVEIVQMGRTELSREIVLEYFQGLGESWT